MSQYSSTAGLARFTRVSLFAVVVLNALMTCSVALEWLLIGEPLERAPAESAEAAVVGLSMCCSGVGVLGALVTSAALLLTWMYRSFKNASALDIVTSFSPGYAVGVWFIPFANLWLPLQAMRSLDAASVADDDETGWSGVAARSDTTVWWVLWIVHNVLSNITFRIDGGGVASVILGTLSTLALAVAAMLLSRIIARVQKGLDRKAGLLAGRVDAEPITF